jgi:predicted XRE-type DNA-binding protein
MLLRGVLKQPECLCLSNGVPFSELVQAFNFYKHSIFIKKSVILSRFHAKIEKNQIKFLSLAIEITLHINPKPRQQEELITCLPINRPSRCTMLHIGIRCFFFLGGLIIFVCKAPSKH